MPTFTIMGSGIGYVGGNYKNDTPGPAAKKAGKALFKKLDLAKFRKYKTKTSIKFVLRMRDRHGPGKTYSYIVTRKKLDTPLIIKRGNVEYKVNYKYFIESCKLNTSELKLMTGGTYESSSEDLDTSNEIENNSDLDTNNVENYEYNNLPDDSKNGGGVKKIAPKKPPCNKKTIKKTNSK